MDDIHSCSYFCTQPSNKGRDIGRRFGRLVVLSEHAERTKYRGIKFVCQCDCGAVGVFEASNLRSGFTKSCGCLKRELFSARKTTHGMHTHGLYSVWCGMRDRCNRKTCRNYKNYGARGISVCAEWDDAGAFIKWGEANGWQPGLQIDRIDNDGNYSPDNCRFVTPAVSTNNRRCTLKYDGTPLAELARAKEVSYWTARSRLAKGATPFIPIKRGAK